MDLALWRDIAVVWLAILCFIGLVIPLAAMLFVVKGMHAAVNRTPALLRQVQGYSRAVRTQSEAASQRIAAPVVQAHREGTRLTTFLNRLLQRTDSTRRGETRE